MSNLAGGHGAAPSPHHSGGGGGGGLRDAGDAFGMWACSCCMLMISMNDSDHMDLLISAQKYYKYYNSYSSMLIVVESALKQ